MRTVFLKTDECFIGKKDSADYHREMNSRHFECWWEKLPDQSVVVMTTRSTIHDKRKTLRSRQQVGERQNSEMAGRETRGGENFHMRSTWGCATS